jgi:hypothetical protein
MIVPFSLTPFEAPPHPINLIFIESLMDKHHLQVYHIINYITFINSIFPPFLFSLHTGNLIPYEYAIALLENAVDNGVELRIRRAVVAIDKDTVNT